MLTKSDWESGFYDYIIGIGRVQLGVNHILDAVRHAWPATEAWVETAKTRVAAFIDRWLFEAGEALEDGIPESDEDLVALMVSTADAAADYLDETDFETFLESLPGGSWNFNFGELTPGG